MMDKKKLRLVPLGELNPTECDSEGAKLVTGVAGS